MDSYMEGMTSVTSPTDDANLSEDFLEFQLDCMETSRLNLSKTTREMCRRLCVLEKEEKVPLNMLQKLWELKSEAHTRLVVEHFWKNGFLDVEMEQYKNGYREWMRLNNSLHEFFSETGRNNNEERASKEVLLQGYGAGLPTTQSCRAWWSTGLKPDGYIHSHLCRLLIACDQFNEVAELLFYPQWIHRMFCVCSFREIRRDFAICLSALEGRVEDSTLKALQILSVAVSMSSKLISKNLREFCFQLYGRLEEYTEKFTKIREFIYRLEGNVRSPWIRPLNDSMRRPNLSNTKMISLENSLNCMAISSDENTVFCGDTRGWMHIVNLNRSEVEHSWRAHEKITGANQRSIRGPSKCLCVTNKSNDGTRTVSVSYGETSKVWRIANLYNAVTLESTLDGIHCLGMMKDGRRVISDIRDGNVQICDIYTRQAVSIKFEDNHLHLLAVEDLGNEHVLTGGINGSIQLWSIATNTQVRNFYHNDFRCLAAFSDGKHFVSGSKDGSLKIWDINGNGQIREFCQESCVDRVFVSADGKRIASSSVDGTICVWDAAHGNQIFDPLVGHQQAVTGLEFIDGGNSIVSCSRDGTIYVWGLCRADANRAADGHISQVNGMSFTPDGKHIVSGGSDGTLCVWDAESGQQIGNLMHSHSYQVGDVAIAPDGQTVFSISHDGTVGMWDFQSRVLLRKLSDSHNSENLDSEGNEMSSTLKREQASCCIAVAPDGYHIVIGSHCQVRVYDIRDTIPTPILLIGHYEVVERVLVSDNGLHIISIDRNGTLIAWDLQGAQQLTKIQLGTMMPRFTRREVLSLLEEPTVLDDTLLSIPWHLTKKHGPNWRRQYHCRQIMYGEGHDKEVLATLDTNISSWRLSPDGKTICVLLENGRLEILELETGQCMRT